VNPAAPQMAGMPTMGAPAPQPAGGGDASQFGEYSDWAQQEMAKGFTPEQLHQQLQESGTQSGGAPEKKGNWLSHMLPMIGSVAAPVLGAALAPATGGLSLVAAAGLSGLGAAGGKAAENAIEGKGIGDNVIDEGVLGAAGGGVGGVAGKFIGKAAGGLGARGERIASETAARNGAEDSIEMAANTYKDVSPQLQKAYKAKDSLAHVTNMGYDIADPTNLVHVANTSNDVLNETLNRALANSGPVDLSHYPQIIKDALAKESGTLGSYEKVALARGRLGHASNPASKLLQQLEDLGAGVAKSKGDPNELRTLVTRLGELAADAKPTVTAATGAVDPVQRSTYNTINAVRSQVKKELYDRPGVTDALKGEIGNLTANPEMNLTQELADHLNGVITKSGNGAISRTNNLTLDSGVINVGQASKGLKEAGYSPQEISDILAQAQSKTVAGKVGVNSSEIHELAGIADKSATGTTSSGAQDLLTEISRNINISKLGEEGKRVGEIVTSTGGKARAAAEAGLDNPGLDTNPLLAAAGTVSPHNGVVGNVVNFGKHAASNPEILSTLSRIGAMGEKLAPAAGSVVATAPNLQADPTGVQPGAGSMMPGGTNGTMGGNMQMQPSNGAHSYQDLINAMEAQAVLAPSMGGNASGFLAQIAPQLQKNQLALSAIQGVPGGFANAGGAQGTGGIMSRIAGLVPGTAAHSYNAQREAAAAQLANAMGISPQQAMGLLPEVMQNEQTAGVTSGILSNMGGQLAY
jgi:hypothetical protein